MRAWFYRAEPGLRVQDRRSELGVRHATSYYAGNWRPFTQDMQLLSGSWTFTFNGFPKATQNITVRAVNMIH